MSDSAPSAPTGLSADITTSSSISLSWSASTDDGNSTITDYTIQYKKSADSSWSIFVDGTSVDTITTVTGLDSDVSYDFRISAVNAVGAGTYSSTISATTLKADSPPTISSISDLTMDEGATKTITVTDSDPDGDKVTLTLSGDTSFATISDKTITLNPDYTDAGDHTITVTATANAKSVDTSFTVTVTVNVITENQNLLNNPYSLSSWNIISNGGNGWLDYETIPRISGNWIPSKESFATSSDWNKKSQTVDIPSDLLSSMNNGDKVSLALTEDYSKTYCGEKINPSYYTTYSSNDQYYLTLRLLDSSGSILSEKSTGIINMTESCEWSRNWHTATVSFSADTIPKNTASIQVEHGGIDGENWKGYYGPVMKGITLSWNVQ
ncbi:MAG: fibronectin type III domain-containing protein [Nitrosopumilus sp.]|nr:fibronectin type III domain-containing protein [Nitrosopumilus sp.]NRA05686.1 fibronectin type III domain-containing protein [Nitrosopumilus sp.]